LILAISGQPSALSLGKCYNGAMSRIQIRGTTNRMDFFADFSGTLSKFEIFIYCVQTFMFIVTVVAGVWGVNQWKEQAKHNTHFDIAKRLALLAYKFDDALEAAQHPLTYPDEFKDRTKTDNETPMQSKILNTRYAHMKRLEPLRDLIQEMRVVNWEAKATIDKDFQSFITKYIDALGKMRMAVISLFDIKIRQYQELGYDTSPNSNQTEMEQKSHEILFGYGEGELLARDVKANTDNLINTLSKFTFKNMS
jgi:hypothetical protein